MQRRKDLISKFPESNYKIHTELGHGLFESVYESVFDYELKNEYGLIVHRQPVLTVLWKGLTIDSRFKPDMIIVNK